VGAWVALFAVVFHLAVRAGLHFAQPLFRFP
jgi:hypothetical protein